MGVGIDSAGRWQMIRLMRIALLIGLAAVVGCHQDAAVDPKWDPLKMPQQAEAALKKELGASTTYAVLPPNAETKDLGWICGIATTSKDDRHPYFVYDKSAGDLRVQPETFDGMSQSQALKVLEFMQYRQPCD